MFGWIRKILTLSPRHKEIEVDLAELSSIWLRYNHSFLPQKAEEVEPKAEESSIAQDTVETTKKEERRYVPQAILSEFIEPHQGLLQSQNAIDGLLGIVELLDRYGGCPSVVKTLVAADSESDEIYSLREILEKVTLREHSLNVARNLLKLLRENYKDYENLIPKALVASLGHDIGKIPEIRESGLYAKADHPLIGAHKIKELFMGKEPLWFEDVLEVIRDHHRASKDSFSRFLREADSRARETETMAYGRDARVAAWEEWFDVRRFLEILKPEVNVIQTGNRWRAFSFGSIVYCQPDLLYESARRLAHEKRVVEMKLLRISEKEFAIKKVVERLKEAGIVGHEIGDGYWGRWYQIQAERFKKKMFLIPLKIEAFGRPHEIEKVKEGYLEIIRAVVPVGK